MKAIDQQVINEFLKLAKINNREEYLYTLRTLFMAFSGSWRGPDRKLINLVWYLLKLEPNDSQKIIRLKETINKKINIIRFERSYSDQSLGSFKVITQHVHWLRIFVCLWGYSGEKTFYNESYYDLMSKEEQIEFIIENELYCDSNHPWWNDNFFPKTFLSKMEFYRSQRGRTEPPWFWPIKTKLYWHLDTKQQQWRDEHCSIKKKLRIHKR